MLTSTIISGQIATLDRNLASLRAHADALSLDAVTGSREAAEELARIKAEIAGLIADREVLEAARTRALIIEGDASEDAQIEARRAARADAAKCAAEALKAAQDMDKAISAFVAAAAALGAAEGETRRHLRLAGQNSDGHVGRECASAHGMFLLARISDGTARRRNDRTVAELVGTAWRELLQEETAHA